MNQITHQNTTHAHVMQRAWAIFRETYRYPQISFAKIGRACFAWSLRRAWAEAREAARVAAIPTPAKAERIASLHFAIERESFNDHYPTHRANVAAMRSEILQLSI